MDSRPCRSSTLVLFFALTTRLVGVAITTVTNLNTYAQADANGFSFTAAYIAAGLRDGVYTLPPGYSNIYDTWGTFLSLFWLIPGPSRVYARLGMAVLGTIAIYNVYVIARHYHSKRAGILAVSPMLVYPSFLFIHVTVLREVMILFGLTTIARLLLVPNPHIKSVAKYVIVAILLTVVTLLRADNLPVYILVLAIAAIFKINPWNHYPVISKVSAGASGIVIPLAVLTYGQQVLDRLVNIRRARARGRTEYLGSVLPETVPEAIAFSWIGAMYFLFTPFPWMVSLVIDFVAMCEGLINLCYTGGAILGVRVLATKTIAGATALTVGIIIGSVSYGLGTANVGTAVRHRQMILWAIFLFGGIGITQYTRITQSNGRL